MKNYAIAFFLLGVLLLTAHKFPGEYNALDQIDHWSGKALDHFGGPIGWYARGGIATLGVVIWMFAKTSE